MEIPNIAKGYLYPSSRVSRCPRFHRCVVTNKCQNYDPHNLDCSVCETRSTFKDMLGGYVPEGEYLPDLQDAVRTMEKTIHKSMAHPDNPTQALNGEEITNTWKKETLAAKMLEGFLDQTPANLENKIVKAMLDPNDPTVQKYGDVLGRMQ